MNYQKDYYAILGVLPDTEEIVIRAAYRALSQRYHPDKNVDAADYVIGKIQEINEAYEVLSDTQKRKQYGDARKQHSQSNDFESDFDNGVRSAFESSERDDLGRWQVAVEYYPDLNLIDTGLRQTSHRLAFAFRKLLLEVKDFENRVALARRLEQHFLETYFGRNVKILSFAKELIMKSERAAARELNKVVAVLGDQIDEKRIIDRIHDKYLRIPRNLDREEAFKPYWLARRLLNTYERDISSFHLNDPFGDTPFTLARLLVEGMGGTFSYEVVKRTIFGLAAAIRIRVSVCAHLVEYENEGRFSEWVATTVAPSVVAHGPPSVERQAGVP